MEAYFIVTDTAPEDTFPQLLLPLLRFAEESVGSPNSRTLAVLLLDPSTGAVTGGLWGNTRWGCLCIDSLYVPEALRHDGLGSQLVRMAEEEAIERGCHCCCLDTYAFQAKSFYEKLGYVVFGTLEGPAPVYPRYFLQKPLAAPDFDPSHASG